MSYTTLDRAKAELKATSTVTNITDTTFMSMAVGFVTARIRNQMRIDFEPVYETRYFDTFSERINSNFNTISLGGNFLLEVSSLTVGGTSYAYGSAVLPYPRGSMPIRALRFSDACNNWYPGNLTYDQAIESVVITGWWGYREDYLTQGWLSADTVQDNPLSASATTITVVDADGLDVLNRTPRFSVGNLLRIEDEMIDVLDVNTTTNVLTVRRGQRGTTAASHVQTTAIKVWETEPTIGRLTARHAAQLYSRRSAFQTAEMGDLGVIQYPADMTLEVLMTLQGYANL